MTKYFFIAALIVLTTVSCKTDLFDAGRTIGDTVIEVQFDLLTYLDDTQKELEYGENPVIPGGGGLTEIYSPVKILDIGDEIGTVKTIESVNIFLDYELENETGWADLEYIVYLSEIGADPFSVPGIHSQSVELRPASSGVSGITITADDRLRELFAMKQFQYAAKLIINTREDPDNIKGLAEIVTFVADVIFTI